MILQEIAPGVYVETRFRRINVGAVLTDEGFVLIDVPPYPDDARAWRALLAQVSNKPILAIVTTDLHRDRMLGNCWFDTPLIVAHDETIAHVKSLPSTFVDTAFDSLGGGSVERSWFLGAQVRIPSVGFTHRMQLRFGRTAIPVLAMPGPTGGSLWVHLPEQRILFAGDSVIFDQHPYVSGPYTKNWLENLTILRRARFAADVIVPGRGPLVDKTATEPISNYLRLARRRVYSLFRAGRPRADTSTLVSELLELFPYTEVELENIQRRIKVGLDRIYEEFKSNGKGSDL